MNCKRMQSPRYSTGCSVVTCGIENNILGTCPYQAEADPDGLNPHTLFDIKFHFHVKFWINLAPKL